MKMFASNSIINNFKKHASPSKYITFDLHYQRSLCDTISYFLLRFDSIRLTLFKLGISFSRDTFARGQERVKKRKKKEKSNRVDRWLIGVIINVTRVPSLKRSSG